MNTSFWGSVDLNDALENTTEKHESRSWTSNECRKQQDITHSDDSSSLACRSTEWGFIPSIVTEQSSSARVDQDGSNDNFFHASFSDIQKPLSSNSGCSWKTPSPSIVKRIAQTPTMTTPLPFLQIDNKNSGSSHRSPTSVILTSDDGFPLIAPSQTTLPSSEKNTTSSMSGTHVGKILSRKKMMRMRAAGARKSTTSATTTTTAGSTLVPSKSSRLEYNNNAAMTETPLSTTRPLLRRRRSFGTQGQHADDTHEEGSVGSNNIIEKSPSSTSPRQPVRRRRSFGSQRHSADDTNEDGSVASHYCIENAPSTSSPRQPLRRRRSFGSQRYSVDGFQEKEDSISQLAKSPSSSSPSPSPSPRQPLRRRRSIGSQLEFQHEKESTASSHAPKSPTSSSRGSKQRLMRCSLHRHRSDSEVDKVTMDLEKSPSSSSSGLRSLRRRKVKQRDVRKVQDNEMSGDFHDRESTLEKFPRMNKGRWNHHHSQDSAFEQKSPNSLSSRQSQRLQNHPQLIHMSRDQPKKSSIYSTRRRRLQDLQSLLNDVDGGNDTRSPIQRRLLLDDATTTKGEEKTSSRSSSSRSIRRQRQRTVLVSDTVDDDDTRRSASSRRSCNSRSTFILEDKQPQQQNLPKKTTVEHHPLEVKEPSPCRPISDSTPNKFSLGSDQQNKAATTASTRENHNKPFYNLDEFLAHDRNALTNRKNEQYNNNPAFLDHFLGQHQGDTPICQHNESDEYNTSSSAKQKAMYSYNCSEELGVLDRFLCEKDTTTTRRTGISVPAAIVDKNARQRSSTPLSTEEQPSSNNSAPAQSEAGTSALTLLRDIGFPENYKTTNSTTDSSTTITTSSNEDDVEIVSNKKPANLGRRELDNDLGSHSVKKSTANGKIPNGRKLASFQQLLNVTNHPASKAPYKGREDNTAIRREVEKNRRDRLKKPSRNRRLKSSRSSNLADVAMGVGIYQESVSHTVSSRDMVPSPASSNSLQRHSKKNLMDSVSTSYSRPNEWDWNEEESRTFSTNKAIVGRDTVGIPIRPTNKNNHEHTGRFPKTSRSQSNDSARYIPVEQHPRKFSKTATTSTKVPTKLGIFIDDTSIHSRSSSFGHIEEDERSVESAPHHQIMKKKNQRNEFRHSPRWSVRALNSPKPPPRSPGGARGLDYGRTMASSKLRSEGYVASEMTLNNARLELIRKKKRNIEAEVQSWKYLEQTFVLAGSLQNEIPSKSKTDNGRMRSPSEA